MVFNYSFKGKGIDASLKPVVKDATHFYKLPDNLYRIQHMLTPGTYDYVFSQDLIFQTKYYWILLKEWFYMLKKGGLLIIEFTPQKNFTPNFLAHQLRRLFGHRIEIVSKEKASRARLTAKKTDYFAYEQSSLEEWSFGIVTNGKADDNVDAIIANIAELGIPACEIIICGLYNGKHKKNKLVRYIEFTEKDELGWITRKKNLIAENAKHENLAIIHDRIFFENDWYRGMQHWGPCFEVINCDLRNFGDEERECWTTSLYEINDPRRASCYLLDYSDWDPWAFVPGAITVIKKSVWAENKYDETRFWNHEEDIALGHELTKKGSITRFNPYSTCYTNRGPRHYYIRLRIKKRLDGRGQIEGPLWNRVKTGLYQAYRIALYYLYYKPFSIPYAKQYEHRGYDAEKKKQKVKQ